ncbi:hypothetical protein LDENG_00209010, partial [Lucifuga dentata]
MLIILPFCFSAGVKTGSVAKESSGDGQVHSCVSGSRAHLGSVLKWSHHPQPAESRRPHPAGQLHCRRNMASESSAATGNMANEGGNETANVANEVKKNLFKNVNLNSGINNIEHLTSQISMNRLIVRRGQPFKLTFDLFEPFNEELDPLLISATTGPHVLEVQGSLSLLSPVQPSASAKAWKMELHESSLPESGILSLMLTPGADVPIGKYTLNAKYKDEESEVAEVVVLFNPWCPDDTVYLCCQKEKQEYVMNEQGIIYRGSVHYIMPLDWNFGQFEEEMVDICLKLLDVNLKHKEDPAADVVCRCDPIYVGRIVSAMINNEDDLGILQGNWSGDYSGGKPPTHWSGSVEILQLWYKNNCKQVKYGQCWVFAGVMCTVMRLLGIPCRVVTNFESAYDNHGNVIIDVFYDKDGAMNEKNDDGI